MSEKRTTANARVTVTLEVDGGGPWGPDCTMAQIYKQAAEHAVGVVERLAMKCLHTGEEGERCNCRNEGRGVRIVGRPDVKAIITVEDRQ